MKDDGFSVILMQLFIFPSFSPPLKYTFLINLIIFKVSFFLAGKREKGAWSLCLWAFERAMQTL